jgi:hypothetical protein
MKNLLNFFFSFDKLFKEKLIVPFFWLAIIVWGLSFFESFLAGIHLGPLAFVVMIIGNIITILLALVVFRLLAEIAIAIFRINDNLSPDGGKSELVDIDPVIEARKAAELAATRTREATRSVSEKASEATKTMRDNVGEMSESVQGKAKAATASVREKTGLEKSKVEKLSVEDKTPVEILEPVKAATPKKRGRPAGSKNNPKTAAAKSAATKTSPKKRGRPAGSKNKTTPPKAAKSTTSGKRGPKPGTKVPRDADGNLLKKDGTPRKKPGPKK